MSLLDVAIIIPAHCDGGTACPAGVSVTMTGKLATQ